MSFGLDQILQFLNSPSFTLWQIIALVYVGLLWLSIIIWVTRDSISRSSSLAFQIFAILINLVVPILGVMLYLIIRPGRTHVERYYETLEKQLLEDKGTDGITCEKCMTVLDKNFIFCPNCRQKLKKECDQCHQSFPSIWEVCPYCGSGYKKNPLKKTTRKR